MKLFTVNKENTKMATSSPQECGDMLQFCKDYGKYTTIQQLRVPISTSLLSITCRIIKTKYYIIDIVSE